MKSVGFLVAILGMFLAARVMAVDALTAGRAAVEDGLHEIATRHLTAALASEDYDDRTRGDAQALLLESLFALGRYEALLKTLDEAEGVKLEAGVGAFWRVKAFLALDRDEEALHVLNEMDIHLDGRWHGRLGRLKANCLVSLGRTQEAMQALEAVAVAIGPSPMRAEVEVDWARLAYDSGRFSDADARLSRVALQESTPLLRQEAAVLRGRTLLAMGRVPEAATLLSSLGRDDALPEDLRSQAWYEAARAYKRLEEVPRRLEALTQSLAHALKPVEKRAAAYRLGVCELEIGQLAAGAARLRHMIREAPGSEQAASAQFALAEALREAEQFEEGLKEYQVYLETFGKEEKVGLAQWGRGWCLLRLDRYSEAVTAFLKAHDLMEDPSLRAESLFKAGDARMANGQFGSARDVFLQLVQSFPNSVLVSRATLQAATCLVKDGETVAAEAAFAAVAGTYTNDVASVEALLRLGQLREADGRTKLAIESYDLALRSTTNKMLQAEALLWRGVVYHKGYRFRLAFRDFSRAAELCESGVVGEQAEYMRVLSAFGMGQDEQALAICRSFMECFPESKWRPDASFWLGKYYFNAGKFEEARERFEQYASEYPDATLADAALLWAGRSAARNREYLEAMALFATLAKTYPESPRLAAARFAQADAMCEGGQFAEAIVLFDEVILKHARSDWVTRAWGRKGDCLFTLAGESAEGYEGAIKAYRAVTQFSDVSMDLILQAEYKIGRCLEKMNKPKAAVEQYYVRVILYYLEQREDRPAPSNVSQSWFAKAAFNASDILVAQQEWRRAVSLLRRVVQVGGPGKAEARERIERIMAERRWLF